MSDTVISVENLSKRYILGHQRSKADGFRHVMEDAVRAPLKLLRLRREQQAQEREEFWALKDVSFEIKQGDVVGIIGRNGAGKSTLLKILSRITEPTNGRITIEGRVASLLEVGTGFHPELTGRENIFLNGAILGMSRVEIKKKFDEIVAFSEVEKFLDTPVKRYSSGMYVRLAFAVAAHLEPEILIVDEVLAVGDAQFQKKCLGKMGEVSQSGRTVIFVSHNMAAVTQLTTRCALLEKGTLRKFGSTEECVAEYLTRGHKIGVTHFAVDKEPRKVSSTQEARFVSLQFDRPMPVFESHEDIEFIATVRANKELPRIRFSMTVFANDGTPVGCCFGEETPGTTAGTVFKYRLRLPQPRLAPGSYYCGVAIGKGNNRVGFVDFDIVLDTLPFEIRPEEGEGGTVSQWSTAWGSIVMPPLSYQQI